MHAITKTVLTTALLSALAMPAQAQLLDHPAAHNRASYTQTERTIAIGISVPVGRTGADTAPRLDLHLSRNSIGATGERIVVGPGTGALRISRSLGSQPTWFINQRQLRQDQRRNGVNTIESVGIGVAAGLAFLAIFAATN